MLALDALGALASKRLGFRYANLAPLSFVIYALTGFLAAGAGDHFLVGAAAAAATGAVDATIGWRISDAVRDEPELSQRMEASIATGVTFGAAIVGGLAGLAA